MHSQVFKQCDERKYFSMLQITHCCKSYFPPSTLTVKAIMFFLPLFLDYLWFNQVRSYVCLITLMKAFTGCASCSASRMRWSARAGIGVFPADSACHQHPVPHNIMIRAQVTQRHSQHSRDPAAYANVSTPTRQAWRSGHKSLQGGVAYKRERKQERTSCCGRQWWTGLDTICGPFPHSSM